MAHYDEITDWADPVVVDEAYRTIGRRMDAAKTDVMQLIAAAFGAAQKAVAQAKADSARVQRVRDELDLLEEQYGERMDTKAIGVSAAVNAIRAALDQEVPADGNEQ